MSTIEMEKEKTTGKYKTEKKFLEFIGKKGNISFTSDEGYVEGKYLSGLEMDDIKFKLKICDEGVDFDEVGTNKTTEEQRQRLLDVILEKPIAPSYNKKMIVLDVPFTSVKTIADKHIDLYLVIDYQTPISKLASIFDDDVQTINPSEDQLDKLGSLLSLFGDDLMEEDSKEENIAKKIEDLPVSDQQKSESIIAMEESFKKMKEEKVQELQNRIDHQKSELKRFEFEKSQADKKIEVAKGDIKVLESRLDSLRPNKDPNGYVFFVSERLNEKVSLEDDIAKIIRNKVSKVKSINVDAFMKLFEDGEYQIRLGKKDGDVLGEIEDYKVLTDDVKKELSDIGIGLVDDKLTYTGDCSWHEIVDKMIKSGFEQDPEFDKMCGSNSYSVGKFAKEPESEMKNIENNNMIKKFNDFNKEDIEELKQEFEENNGYEMGDNFIFAMSENTDTHRDPNYAPFILSIQPKSYWDNEQCQYDQHVTIDNGGVLDLPQEFEEVMESSFLYLGSDPVECIDKLIKLGINFDPKFNSYMESHVGTNYRINGLLVEDYMKQNYPNSIV